ncbi:2-oxoglutarate dehydrogenase, E1 component [Candidatus Karelsulcia muelleri DMIN]|uniref:oxoglutarate dehydrogenase (succinyl-transferring) n=1 Tax=Karelsulcia muelleri (strain DMIN) TaxID=641892 RepID=D5D8U0_KARMD|nr:2-oxoglutarate dehydrogenase, E1 component [Candidatus Karelsulcia muelleri DMIN]
MDRYSFLNTINHQQIEILYKKYLEDPDSIEHSWRAFFQGFDFYKEKYTYFCKFIKKKKSIDTFKEINVLKLINFYKKEGHLFAKINPISEKIDYPTLNIKKFFLEKEDLDKIFVSSKEIGLPPCTLREIIFFLKKKYCESIGLEYMYLYNPEQINWINNWINNNNILYNNEKFKILININKATKFENFIHTKFVGQKRFSIEGNESILPAINYIIEYSSINYSIKDFVIGMSHRGRLNILCNILKKNCKKIFSEFFGKEYIEKKFLGDVKYHLGDNIYIKNKIGREIHIMNVPNSSHLESVSPIVEGIVRAKIDNDYNCNFNKVIPILIHGDAAFSAQGIAYEVIQMSLLEGYKTGGTIHIIVNNQIGFTTNCSDSRSSIYCTDLAKVILSPVIHVNSDDVESVIYSIRFAIDFRMSYNKDVFVDLLGYRKYGHNEGDDPRFTQPNIYKIIDNNKNLYFIYKNKLKKNKLIYKNKIKFYEKKYKNYLNNGFIKSKFEIKTKLDNFLIYKEKLNYANYKVLINEVKTTFKKNILLKIGNKIYNVPKNKKFYNKTVKFLKIKKKKLLKKETVDWGIAELLAYGSLLYEGYNIRLSGEDVERGTFAHRHIVIISEFEEKIYLLNNIRNGQGKLYVYNSLLSEYGVLGFEYGYSMFNTNTLTLWEAQFGDFSNSAQIIIDQYLSSAETKWKIKNGIVLLLPHGEEGQGSEHSSSRIERYLQLCANYNMFICNCSTPSNFYHLLRRQIKFVFIKPLIIFTPKSLLRNIQCISSLSELYNGKFEEFIDDKYVIKNYVDTLVFCSGKIYYDIFKKRKILNKKNLAIIRIEQLYPIINNLFEKILIQYTNKRKIIWVQEEPENMGVWPYLFRKYSKIPWILISPPESSAPSIGRNNLFLKNYLKLINKVFNT